MHNKKLGVYIFTGRCSLAKKAECFTARNYSPISVFSHVSVVSVETFLIETSFSVQGWAKFARGRGRYGLPFRSSHSPKSAQAYEKDSA